jgi:large subunit ribosomal protein L19
MSNSNPLIEAIEASYKRSDIPEFRPGDTIRVHAKISEGGKDRIQVFQGVCIHRKKGGARGSFTVRKISHGVGVERVWAVNSPRVVKIELVTRGKVHKAKLYYLRNLSGNAARIRARLGGYASELLENVGPNAGGETSDPATAKQDSNE